MSRENLILVFFFFFTAANAQESQKPNQSKSEYIAKTIVSLNLAIDTDDIQAYQNLMSFGKKLVELQAKQLRGQQQVKSKYGFYYHLDF
ncbi:hypothetical protein [Roseivirga seohaensis]|uniref:hypothetical protein n=1 Tax=Roseivirga seohaensis TaxID=1914963 RepID=UPI003BAA1001